LNRFAAPFLVVASLDAQNRFLTLRTMLHFLLSHRFRAKPVPDFAHDAPARSSARLRHKAAPAPGFAGYGKRR